MRKFKFKPVIIIGAARSGTNMLRDLLTTIDNFATWPCDEINYIWRYDNAHKTTDQFSVDDVTKRNKNYIRRQFEKLHKKTEADYIVEKTCANSLRVDFVNQILPEAKYIYIYRDPLDVVASAKKRWSAPLDLGYILKKARYVPIKDLPYYALKYIWNRIYKIINNEERLAFWGPKFRGLDEVLKDNSLEEVCAIQWEKCNDRTLDSFTEIDNNKIYNIAYEDFVYQPTKNLANILKFINNKDYDKMTLDEIVKDVSTSSVKKGYNNLSQAKVDKIENLTKQTYERIKEEYED